MKKSILKNPAMLINWSFDGSIITLPLYVFFESIKAPEILKSMNQSAVLYAWILNRWRSGGPEESAVTFLWSVYSEYNANQEIEDLDIRRSEESLS